jgi:chromate transport protein ChrA
MLSRYIQILRIGLRLGSSVFGGISVAYPVIRQEAPKAFGLSESEVDGLYALAYLLPGPSFLNLWGAVCMRVAGIPGAVLGEIALLLPSLLLVFVLPLLGRITWLAARSSGILAGAAWSTVGLMIASGIDFLRRLKGWDLAVAAALLVILALGLHPLAGLGLVVACYTLLSLRQRKAVNP